MSCSQRCSSDVCSDRHAQQKRLLAASDGVDHSPAIPRTVGSAGDRRSWEAPRSTAKSARSEPPIGRRDHRTHRMSARGLAAGVCDGRLSLARARGATHPSEDPLSWVVGWSAESAGVGFRTWARSRRGVSRCLVAGAMRAGQPVGQPRDRCTHRLHAVCDHAEAIDRGLRLPE